MKNNTFYLNGSKIRSLHTLAKELRNTFYFSEDLNLKSMDVINDVMGGGYGLIYPGEVITIVWQNHQGTKHKLAVDIYNFMIQVFNGNPNVTLILE